MVKIDKWNLPLFTSGVHKFRRLVTRATICYTMALEVFSVLHWIFLKNYIQKHVSVHTHWAERASWGSRVVPELWSLSVILAACHPSGVCDLEVASIFFENLLTPGLRTCMYVFQRFLTVVRCNGAAVTAVKEVTTVRSDKTGCFVDLPDVHLFKVRWFPKDRSRILFQTRV